MSFTHTIGITWSGGTTTVTGSFTNTADGEDNRDVTVPAANTLTPLLVNMACDVSQLKSLLISSDKDISIKTNDPDTPQETIPIKAGVPYIYVSNAGANNAVPFAGDVTVMYFLNAGASPATVKIRMLQDSTP
jgi:hypothetical protein